MLLPKGHLAPSRLGRVAEEEALRVLAVQLEWAAEVPRGLAKTPTSWRRSQKIWAWAWCLSNHSQVILRRQSWGSTFIIIALRLCGALTLTCLYRFLSSQRNIWTSFLGMRAKLHTPQHWVHIGSGIPSFVLKKPYLKHTAHAFKYVFKTWALSISFNLNSTPLQGTSDEVCLPGKHLEI